MTLSQEGERAGTSAPREVEPGDGAGGRGLGTARRVLVVDDEFTIRMLITEVLSDIGVEAIEAADGQTALSLLAQGDRIDLLVTDMGLPGGMSGRDLAEAARGLRPEIEVLFITGYADGAERGVSVPRAHMLVKPFSMDALAMKVQAILTV